MAVIGQLNELTKPEGIVRAIYDNGWIYEGNMTPNRKRNGWGICYTGDKIFVGWWSEGSSNGNMICYDPHNNFQIDQELTGWYNVHKIGELKENTEFKNIEYSNTFI